MQEENDELNREVNESMNKIKLHDSLNLRDDDHHDTVHH